MRLARIYQASSLFVGDIVALDLRASHHLLNVLRLRTNDQIVLFNGENVEYEATLEMNGKNVLAHITGIESVQRDSPIQLILIQGISRGDHMDWAIQKAIELGVTQIIPIYCQRSMKYSDEKRMQKKHRHWQGIIISACEQSGRCKLPLLKTPQSLKHYLDSRPTDALSIVLDPTTNHSLKNVLTPNQRIEILIGPEGGLSEQEIDTAVNAGFKCAKLGPRILRTETAGVAALAVIQAELGDL